MPGRIVGQWVGAVTLLLRLRDGDLYFVSRIDHGEDASLALARMVLRHPVQAPRLRLVQDVLHAFQAPRGLVVDGPLVLATSRTYPETRGRGAGAERPRTSGLQRHLHDRCLRAVLAVQLLDEVFRSAMGVTLTPSSWAAAIADGPDTDPGRESANMVRIMLSPPKVHYSRVVIG